MIEKILAMLRDCVMGNYYVDIHDIIYTKKLHIDADDHKDLYLFIAMNLMDHILDDDVTWLGRDLVYNKKYDIIVDFQPGWCNIYQADIFMVKKILHAEKTRYLIAKDIADKNYTECVCRINNL